MRKKVFVAAALLLIAIVVGGCAPKAEKKTGIDFSKADAVTIMYGTSSYAMHSQDKKTIESVLDSFKTIVLVPTDKSADVATTLSVVFEAKGEKLASFRVDENGVFGRDDDTHSYVDSSNSFDYAALKSIYENSKTK